MTIPNYLVTFRRAVREREANEKNELNEKGPPLFRLFRLFRTPRLLKKGLQSLVKVVIAHPRWLNHRQKAGLTKKTN